MNHKQAYYFALSSAFRAGFHDYRDRKSCGYQFSARMSTEWQRGWKWAELNT